MVVGTVGARLAWLHRFYLENWEFMKRERLVLSVVLSALPMIATFAAPVPVKPNVIVIVADDLGYADVGFNGCQDIPTPNIDSLARQGVRFSSGYVSHPFCSPTRAALMTGRYQQRFGHETNPDLDVNNPALGLPTDQITVAEVLKQAGYRTIAVGKWHLGGAPCFHPNARGFTDFFGFLDGGHLYLPSKLNPKNPNSVMRNHEPVGEPEYMTDALSREAASYIRKYQAQPFFLYLAYNAVHRPLQATEKYLARFSSITDERRRTYAAMTSAMDDGIGQVLQTLREQNLERNTLVFFFSDNGGPRNEALPAHNDPLRGHKGDLFEGGIRVPFVMRWLGHLPKGEVYDEPVSAIDVFPTATALAGAKLPSNRKPDGVNLMPFLLGEKSGAPHPRLFWRTGGGVTWAVREGRYKLVQNDPGPPELYDLSADVSETKNIAKENGEVVRRLLQAQGNWNAELIPPLWAHAGAQKTPAAATGKDSPQPNSGATTRPAGKIED